MAFTSNAANRNKREVEVDALRLELIREIMSVGKLTLQEVAEKLLEKEVEISKNPPHNFIIRDYLEITITEKKR